MLRINSVFKFCYIKKKENVIRNEKAHVQNTIKN